MNNKGITLLEVLLVIMVIMIIIALVFPSVSRAITKSKQAEFVTTVTLAFYAAENYIDDAEVAFEKPALNETKTITIEELAKAKKLNNVDDISSGKLLLANENGIYRLYAYISSNLFKIEGAKVEDVADNVQVID